MRTFYFLRHGQTAWNVAGKLQGQSSDIPLNETGHAQAKLAATCFLQQRIDRIVSSRLSRAFVTAHYVSKATHAPLETDDRLLERNYGTIEAMTGPEIQQAKPELLFDLTAPVDTQGYHLPLGAETMEQVGHRGVQAVSEWLAKNPTENILFVAHGAWFRSVMSELTQGGLTIRSDNAVPYRCTPANGTWLLESLML